MWSTNIKQAVQAGADRGRAEGGGMAWPRHIMVFRYADSRRPATGDRPVDITERFRLSDLRQGGFK